MEGIRCEVLPPNQQSIDIYFAIWWKYACTLTFAVVWKPHELGTNNLDGFKSYLEAEEARLSINLKAVNYIIDSTDNLTLLTGVGRIEKVCASLCMQ